MDYTEHEEEKKTTNKYKLASRRHCPIHYAKRHTTRIPQVPATGRQHKQRDETCRTLNDNNFNLPHHQAKSNCPRGHKARHQNGAGCLAMQNGADQASITRAFVVFRGLALWPPLLFPTQNGCQESPIIVTLPL